MSVVLEAVTGSVVLFGMICRYAWHKYDKYKLKKQYPKTFSQTVEKYGDMTLSLQKHEMLTIVSAIYGPYDLKNWIETSMDTYYLQFSVDDDTLQCEPTPPDTKLVITWTLEYLDI